MKKSLVALAVIAAAGSASAQSSVQLYGLADIWFGQAKIDGTFAGDSLDWKQTKLDSGGVNTSRWGLKGVEDLGGGLKAHFNLEQGLALDTGAAGGSFNRVATVGLSGNFGSVVLGKDWTPYHEMADLAKNTLRANISSQTTTWVGYNENPSNTIKYSSPTFNGFSGALSYSLGEDKQTLDINDDVLGKSTDTLSLSVKYANGPLVVGYAHQTAQNQFTAVPGIILTGASLSGETLDAGELSVFAKVDGVETTYNLLTGSYDFGVAKLVGSFNRAQIEELKANEYQIGVDIPLAANLTLSGGYAHSKLKADGDEFAKTRGFSAALAYALSKRTTAYAALNNTKLTAGDDEVKATVYAVGMKHSF
jgi:predicted porin